MRSIELPKSEMFRLRNATVATTFLARPERFAPDKELVRLDIDIERGRIAALVPAAASRPPAESDLDLDGGMVWPCLADIHTHCARASRSTGRCRIIATSTPRSRRGWMRGAPKPMEPNNAG